MACRFCIQCCGSGRDGAELWHCAEGWVDAGGHYGCASDDVLHIVDPDERHMRVSMSAVDRAATLKLNRERKLDLYLPASRGKAAGFLLLGSLSWFPCVIEREWGSVKRFASARPEHEESAWQFVCISGGRTRPSPGRRIIWSVRGRIFCWTAGCFRGGGRTRRRSTRTWR